MKSLASIFIAIIISTSVFAGDNLQVNFCNQTSNILSLSTVISCKQITVSNPNYTVKSASIHCEVNGTEYNWTLENGAISSQVQQNLQSLQPTQIVIKGIVLEDENNKERVLKSSTFIKVTP